MASQNFGAGLPHRRPQNAGPKKIFNINVIQIAIHIKFMKCKYNIVYTNK
jgi:hypothetical protein